jgi:hypothetical protein
MISTVIKHFIYDLCIDAIFGSICNNFEVNKKTVVPVVGQFYRQISHIYGDEHYHNCVVKRVESRDGGDIPYHIISVTYEYATGLDLEAIQDKIDSFGSDDDYELYTVDEDRSISDLFDEDDLEFLEMEGLIALNSKYYRFTL